MEPININFKLNNSDFNINVKEMPILSEKAISIFNKLDSSHAPSENRLLKARINKLQEIENCLQEAKSPSMREKILAILSTALSVALLATSILIFTNVIPLAPIFGMVTLIAYIAFTSMANTYFLRKNTPNYDEFKKHEGLDLFTGLCPLGPVMPVWDVFYRKVSKLKSASEDVKKDISRDLEHNVYHQVSYFKHEYNKLTPKIDQFKHNLLVLKQLAKTQADEKDAEEKIEIFNKATDELTKAKTFYSQFSAAIP